MVQEFFSQSYPNQTKEDMKTLSVFAIIFVLSPLVTADQKLPDTAPVDRPSLPPAGMTVSLPDKVSLSKGGNLPLTLTFAKDAGANYTFTNSVVTIVLLDEAGRQVRDSLMDPFHREAAVRQVTIDDHNSVYAPSIALNRTYKGLQVGSRYQLVCTLPTHGVQVLAGSAWFTLTE